MATKNDALLAWIKTKTAAEIKKQTGTTLAYLRLIAYGHKTASPEIAVSTEIATHGLVTRKQLLPNDWQKLWPELSDTKRKKSEAA